MKKTILAGLVVLSFAFGLLMAQQHQASAKEIATARVTAPAAAPAHLPIVTPDADQYAKKCNFNSDCPYGKCKGGTCGGCDFNSDCKGWGKCKGGQCGACDFSSDCKDFGGCSSGHCAKSPY